MAFVLTFLLRRLGQGIVIVLLVGFLVFALLRVIPGDPVRIMLGPMTPDDVLEEMAEELGLRDPLPLQFGRYLVNLSNGDMGHSFIKAKSGASVAGSRDRAEGEAENRADVLDLVLTALPYTLQLAGLGILFAFMTAIPLGIFAGLNPGGWTDRLAFLCGTVFVSLPNIWLAIVLILLVSTQLQWLPAIGYRGFAYTILPAIVLAVEMSPPIIRALSVTVAGNMQQSYVPAGLARGLSRRHMIVHHVLRNTAIPMLNLFGAQLSALLLGSLFVVEYIFDYPGLGLLTINAVFQRDFPVIQGVAILATASLVMVNILVDLASAFIDRRLQY